MQTGEVIKTCRLQRGLSQEELGKLLGVNKAAVQKWESGAVKNLKRDKILKLADVFDISPAALMGWESPPPFEHILPVKTKKIPLLGSVVSGGTPLPRSARAVYATSTLVDADFCLIVKDEAMSGTRIRAGDVVFVCSQYEVSDGAVAAVAIDGEVTLRRVYRSVNRLILSAENPAYPPLIYSADEATQVNILGKVIGFQSGEI